MTDTLTAAHTVSFGLAEPSWGSRDRDNDDVDGDDVDGEDVDDEEEEGEDDAGSLVDFIVKDDEAETGPPVKGLTADESPLTGIDVANIIVGKRVRRQTKFFEQEFLNTDEYRKMLLCDVPKDEMQAAVDSDTDLDETEDEDDSSFTDGSDDDEDTDENDTTDEDDTDEDDTDEDEDADDVDEDGDADEDDTDEVEQVAKKQRPSINSPG